VIIVIGEIVGRGQDGPEVAPAGPAAAVALAAAESGAAVEVVTRIGDDPTGDAVLLALSRAGVGHVATIRDAGRRTPLVPDTTADADPGADATLTDPIGVDADAPAVDAADIGLALRYLSDYRVIVLMHPSDQAILREASAAAGWAGAHLIVVTLPSSDPVGELPAGALAITADEDTEGVAALLGRYAAAVDRREDPRTAYAALTASLSE
jgi:sugar/nucleoside kinase (ribokinase family)